MKLRSRGTAHRELSSGVDRSGGEIADAHARRHNARPGSEATHVGKRSFVLPPLDCRLEALHPCGCETPPRPSSLEMKKVEVEVGALGSPLSNWNTISVIPR